MNRIVIIGGGAAGLVSAITAKTKENEVIILERNQTCGKKILATGNGKCNYWNIDQNLSHYHSTNEELLSTILTKDIQEETLAFFCKLGIIPKIKNGYYYPFTNQATTIKDALFREAERKNVIIKTNYLVESIIKQDNSFIITGEETIKADKVIIATGSCASPKTGSDGSGYKLLKELGHTIIEPLPSLVQLKTRGQFLKKWAGVRTDVEISLYEDNKLIKKEQGEIQLTDYGISGICVFNLSRFVAIGLKKNKKQVVKINFLPFIKSSPKEYLTDFFQNTTHKLLRAQLEGFLNSKLVNVILELSKIEESKSFNDLSFLEQETLIELLTSFHVEIIGTNSFEQAQVCSGGVPITEINTSTMESKIIKDLYIVGELLDVDGDCGGYNLGFAWMSGILAGKGCSLHD